MGAVISECGQFRYALTREWWRGMPSAVFVMLNPSTADAEHDDATIKKCIWFAKAFGHGGLKVFNLYAYRATDPKDLVKAGYLTGPENLSWLDCVSRHQNIIVAWGAAAPTEWQKIVAAILTRQNAKLWCLGVNANGSPKHPLYLKNNTTLIPWDPEGLK